MSRRIQEDHKEFRDVVAGKVGEQVNKFIKNGKLIGWRPQGGRFIINVPQIDLPTFRYGKNKTGVGRGPGEPGDKVGQDPQKGKDKGKPGDTPGDTIPVGIDLKDIVDYLKCELELPNLQPKDCTDVFKEKLVYNGIRKNGPESLRHTKRTMKNAMMRLIQTGEYDPENPIIIPISDDKRYRSWNVKKIPQSNAAIFFARDWSGSMDDQKCNAVINTAWWIDVWIRQFYERTETIYIGHDTRAQEVDQETFYKMRYGGGTKCSSALELIKERITYKFQPNQWNIYVFYFSDGENWMEDNSKSVDLIKELMPSTNLIGIGQILYHSYSAQENSFLQTIQNGVEVDDNILRLFNYTKYGEDQELQMIKKFLGKNRIQLKQEEVEV